MYYVLEATILENLLDRVSWKFASLKYFVEYWIISIPIGYRLHNLAIIDPNGLSVFKTSYFIYVDERAEVTFVYVVAYRWGVWETGSDWLLVGGSLTRSTTKLRCPRMSFIAYYAIPNGTAVTTGVPYHQFLYVA